MNTFQMFVFVFISRKGFFTNFTIEFFFRMIHFFNEIICNNQQCFVKSAQFVLYIYTYLPVQIILWTVIFRCQQIKINKVLIDHIFSRIFYDFPQLKKKYCGLIVKVQTKKGYLRFCCYLYQLNCSNSASNNNLCCWLKKSFWLI